VAVGVAEPPATLAVEMVGQRVDDLSPGGKRALPGAVDVLPVGGHDHVDGASGLGRSGGRPVGGVLRQHHDGVADAQLGVDEGPVGRGMALAHGLGAEGRNVEVDRVRAVGHDQARGDGRQMRRDRRRRSHLKTIIAADSSGSNGPDNSLQNLYKAYLRSP